MLQYIKWLWENDEKKCLDKLVTIIAVSKIENFYLKYKSRNRSKNRDNQNIKQMIGDLGIKATKNNKKISHNRPLLPCNKKHI